MKLEGIIFDFGFTLFQWNPKKTNIEKYFDCFLQSLKRSADLLIKLNIFKDTSVVDKFINRFNKIRMKSFRESIKTKLEIPTISLFQIVLDYMLKKNEINDFGVLSEKDYQELAELYHSCELDEWIPFEQTKSTLEKLSKIENLKLAVLSNHPHHSTIKKLLNKHDLTQFFDVIVTSAKFGKRKPHSEIFHHTLERMGLKQEGYNLCLMCGDEYADIVGGHRVGMQTILCERTVKFPFEKEITIPDIKKIANISEILDFIS